MERIILKVEGMVCGQCEITVKEAARKLDGVGKAKASRRRKEAAVDYEPSLVTPEEIVSAINSTGYKASLV